MGIITNNNNNNRKSSTAPRYIVLGADNCDEWLPEYLDEDSRRFCRITSVQDIAPAVRELLRFATETSRTDYRFRAVQRKYGTDRYGAVARDPIQLPLLTEPIVVDDDDDSSSAVTSTTNTNVTSTQQQQEEQVTTNEDSAAVSRQPSVSG
jgi:hypothetical protein